MAIIGYLSSRPAYLVVTYILLQTCFKISSSKARETHELANSRWCVTEGKVFLYNQEIAYLSCSVYTLLQVSKIGWARNIYSSNVIRCTLNMNFRSSFSRQIIGPVNEGMPRDNLHSDLREEQHLDSLYR